MVRDSSFTSNNQQLERASSGGNNIAVVGGGVIGLSCAWRLAQSGVEVTLFDADHAGKGGSWAAAGMLAASVESRAQTRVLRSFNRWSAELWPNFAKEIVDTSGTDIGYDTGGTLLFEENAGEGDPKATGLCGEHLSATEPFLEAGYSRAQFFAGDHSVDSRCLLTALRTAGERAGVVLRNKTLVEMLVIDGRRVVGFRAAGKTFAADAVCLTAGAWTNKILEASGLETLPIRPIKGQMLCLQMDPKAPVVRHVIWGNGVYLVPRRDGRLVVGATMEETGFDTLVTTEAIAGLRMKAETVIPELKNLPVVETWAGLRAGSPDEAPLLGTYEMEGLFIASGHHRNGILQAPATAQVLTECMQTGSMPDIAKPFDPSRFK